MSADVLGAIQKQNNAWLIELQANGTEDCPAHELFSAAGSIATAKRILKEMAREYGCTSMRWEQHGETLWRLLGVAPEWEN